jgi:hypothetical protein
MRFRFAALVAITLMPRRGPERWLYSQSWGTLSYSIFQRSFMGGPQCKAADGNGSQFGYLFSFTNVFGRKPSLTSQKIAIFDLNYKI